MRHGNTWIALALVFAAGMQPFVPQARAAANDGDAAAYRMPVATTVDAERWRQWQQAVPERLAQRPWLKEYREASGPPPFLNRLIDETSPYLLQHAFQPVDWHAWQPPDGAGGKLRLVSIGYSTCHWCHEMARRSFSDPAIAAVLNEAFLAIKVDREELPEIDRRYTDLQQRLTGSRGWPVTVIETARGEPVYVGAYLEPEQLGALLKRLSLLAHSQPSTLQALVDIQQRLLAETPEPAAYAPPSDTDATTVTADAIAFLAQRWDQHSGGLAGEQKFPNPPALEWLLRVGLQEQSMPLQAAVSTQLDAMLGGGLYDPRAGGFFRYSTRSDWSHPHFEKMLHTQAQLLRLYALGARLQKRDAWLQVARDTLRFTDEWLLDRSTGLYRAAVDAQYRGAEGGFYLLQDAAALTTARETGFDTHAAGAGQTLTFPPSQLRNPASLDTMMDALRTRLPLPAARPFIDDKQLTGWNALHAMAMLALDLAEGKPLRRDRAVAIANQLWSRFDPASGRLARDQFGAATGSAEDFAYMTALLIELFDHTGQSQWLDRARRLLDQGLADGVAVPRNAADWHDAELPAPALVLCRAADALQARGRDEASIGRSARCHDALRHGVADRSRFPWLAPDSPDTQDALARLRYFADGHGHVGITRENPGGVAGFTLRLQLDPGWHVNAARITHPRLTPTRLLFDDNVDISIDYPAGDLQQLEFSSEPLQLYQGEIRLQIGVEPGQRGVLQLQACSDRICLLPERLSLDFW